MDIDGKEWLEGLFEAVEAQERGKSGMVDNFLARRSGPANLEKLRRVRDAVLGNPMQPMRGDGG